MMAMSLRSVVCAVALLGVAIGAGCERDGPEAKPPPRGNPSAEALFDGMLAAFRNGDTLSYRSAYTWERPDHTWEARYEVRLAKPGCARVAAGSQEPRPNEAVIVTDDQDLWLYWPTGRPPLYGDDGGGDTGGREYYREERPADKRSIAHVMQMSGVSMGLPVVDPSVFHGYDPPIYEHIDDYEYLRTEDIRGLACDVIRLKLLEGSRLWTFWIARKDRLPRRVEQRLITERPIRMVEEWTDVRVDAPMDADLFAWRPPEEWERYYPPSLSRLLPRPGTDAPDLRGETPEGARIDLEDFRGRPVWLYFWHRRCPPCVKGIERMQELHERFADDGLVVLGVNNLGDPKGARVFLRDHGVTFPTVMLGSGEAGCIGDYGIRGVPASCVIDRNGRIVDAWYGWDGERVDSTLDAIDLPAATGPSTVRKATDAAAGNREP